MTQTFHYTFVGITLTGVCALIPRPLTMRITTTRNYYLRQPLCDPRSPMWVPYSV